MRLRPFYMLGMLALMAISVTARADDDPRFQAAQRTVPWTPVYPIGTANSCTDPRPHQTGVFNNESAMIGTSQRIYRIVVPANYDGNRPIGLLLGFQGFHDAEVNYLWSTGFEDYNESAYWISATLAMRPFTGYDSAVQNEAKNEDLQFFQHVLGELRSRYNIDEDRIYATGFSNGANFIRFLGYVYPKMLAAINPNMGSIAIAPREGATYASIAVGGLRDVQYLSADINRQIYDQYRKLGLEMECHEFDIGHNWPSPDTTFDPPRQWTQAVVDFFLMHPRNYHTVTQNTPTVGHLFIDDFDQPGMMNGHNWRKERFLADGILCDNKAIALIPNGGYLQERSHLRDPHGIVCLTDFIPRPATWSITFTLNTLKADEVLYPATMRDSTGRSLSLRLDAEAWRWQLAATENAFRCDDTQNIETLSQGKFTPEPGCNYILTLEHTDEITWRLSGDGQELASGSIDDASMLNCDYRFGFGLRSTGSSVAFDRVALTQDPVETPQQYNILLANYFTSFGDL